MVKKNGSTGLWPVTSEKYRRGGTGFQPVSSFKITKRNLPHWQEPNRTYFLSWRCATGENLTPEERKTVSDALRYWDGQKWTVYAAVVMPDHVHVLAQPLPQGEGKTFDLGEILHSVKSFSAHRIDRMRERHGSVWQDERYDRIVRDDKEFQEKWEYIRNNPVKNGLCQRPEDYLWLYEKKD